jgi:inorganic pyrophosphatase
MATHDFWQALDSLISMSEIVIDRPRGTTHPRYPDFIYPLDYGYLQGTASNDGSGIDVWLGSQSTKLVTALIVNIDLQKRDAEIKVLLGCTPDECQAILAVHDQSSWGGLQSAILLERSFQ